MYGTAASFLYRTMRSERWSYKSLLESTIQYVRTIFIIRIRKNRFIRKIVKVGNVKPVRGSLLPTNRQCIEQKRLNRKPKRRNGKDKIRGEGRRYNNKRYKQEEYIVYTNTSTIQTKHIKVDKGKMGTGRN